MSALAHPVSTIDTTIATFRTWLHMDDADALLATLGAVAANNLAGDPVWLLLVGPPGGGKSEILQALTGLEYTRTAGTLTEASLLSGTPKKDTATAAKGGLLREIGEFGIVVAKDFGSILSMNTDARQRVLAALREIYDGSWTRLVGSDGGRALEWAGKVGFVGGVTPTIDRHHAVMGAMGERFMFYRLPSIDTNVQARRALQHAGQEKRMRQELAAAIAHLFQTQGHSRELTDEETERLITLAVFLVKVRSAVERDGYTREIELIPAAEAPTRFPISLSLLLRGLHSIGVPKPDAWRILDKVAFDSVPALRLEIIKALRAATEQLSTTELATIVRYPNVTTRRACEDLTAHGILDRHAQGEGKAHEWSLTSFTVSQLDTLRASKDSAATVSRMPERVIHNLTETSTNPSETPSDEPPANLDRKAINQETSQTTSTEKPEALSPYSLSKERVGFSGTLTNDKNCKNPVEAFPPGTNGNGDHLPFDDTEPEPDETLATSPAAATPDFDW